MATTNVDYESGPIKSAAESYVVQLEREESLRLRMIEMSKEYELCRDRNRELEKILGARIKDNCVTTSNGRVLFAYNSLCISEYRISIKQAIK